MTSPHQSKQVRPLMLYILVLILLIVATQVVSAALHRQTATSVPGIVSFQGKVTVSGQPYNGAGYFKFTVVDASGNTTYWSNDGTATGVNEPATGIMLNVQNGLFTVLLGDTALKGMIQPLNAEIFRGSERYLRVWFSTDNISYTKLSPDQRITAVPYALVAQEAVSASNADKLDGQHATELAVPSGAMLLGTPGDTRLTNAGYQYVGTTNVTANGYNGAWSETSITNAPAGRHSHTAVWTGNEIIVWGGENITNGGRLNSGARYNPMFDTWETTSTTNAPGGRMCHTAVWTGSEMIIWGGWNNTNLNTGGRYNPTNDTWTTISTTNAPSARCSHEAVWTGSEMTVWGGHDDSNFTNSGGRYNPITDTWTTISTTDAPSGRRFMSMIWTGSEVIIWGGEGNIGYLNTGGRYNPISNTWTNISMNNAPSSRSIHTALWTGGEMIIWGGQGIGGHPNTGARYNPTSDIWTATSTTSAPAGRDQHTAVWTGSEMIIWGGWISTNTNTGSRYNPTTDTWTILPNTNVPESRNSHTAVWAGSEMIVWGGSGETSLNTGGRYTALLSLYQKK